MNDPRLDPEAIKANRRDYFLRNSELAYDIVKAIAEAPEPVDDCGDIRECTDARARAWWLAARALVGGKANE